MFECLEDRRLLALVIDPGSLVLLPNTPQQAIPIQVARTVPASDPMVTGFNLRAQLGDGLGPAAEPVFQAVDFGGGIWDAYATTKVGGPVSGIEQFAQASVLFNSQGQAVAAEGLVVTLIVSTVGISQGRYDLRLAATGIGADSDFIGLQGVSIPVAISIGTIDIRVHPWQNPIDRFDVSGDARITPLDALMIINDLNARGSRELPVPAVPPPYLDVNGDDSCTPLDVLQVVNLLNERSASRHLSAVPPPVAPSAAAEGEWLSAAPGSWIAHRDQAQVPVWPWPAGQRVQPPAMRLAAANSPARSTPVDARALLFSSGLELGLDLGELDFGTL